MVTKNGLLSAFAWLFLAIPVCYASGYASAGAVFNGGTITTPLAITPSTDAVALTATGASGGAADLIQINSFGNTGGNLLKLNNGGALFTYQLNAGSNILGGGVVGTNVNAGYLYSEHSSGAAPNAILKQGSGTGDFLNCYGASSTLLTSIINNGSVVFSITGVGTHLKSGANGLVGSGALVAGTATITNTAIDANDIVLITDTSATPNAIGENKASRVAATSFVVVGTGTDTFDYVIQKVD